MTILIFSYSVCSCAEVRQVFWEQSSSLQQTEARCYNLTHKLCRGAAQFLLCRNTTSHYFSHVTICVFSQQPRITTQRICRGRRPRRPDPSTFRIALLFIPQTMTTPTYIRDCSFLRKIAPLFADFTLYWRIVKRCRVHHSDSTFI